MSEFQRVTSRLVRNGFQVLLLHESGKIFVKTDVVITKELPPLLPSLLAGVCKFAGDELNGIGLLETTVHKIVFKRLAHLVLVVVGTRDISDEDLRTFLSQFEITLSLVAQEKWGEIVMDPGNLARAIQTWSPAFIMDLFKGYKIRVMIAPDLDSEVDPEAEHPPLTLFFDGISSGYNF